MARMKAVQARKPGSDWEVIEREIPEPPSGQVRIKVEACGICHSDMFIKEGHWPVFDTRVCRDTRWPAESTRWDLEWPCGKSVSASVSAGMAAIAVTADRAAAVILSCVGRRKFAVSVMTEDGLSISWCRKKPWLPCPTIWRPMKRRRCCARVLLRLTV